MMDRERINALGDELYDALRSGQAVSPLTDREGDIQIEDAYHISLRVLDRRVEGDGETIVGKKIGVISKPVQEMLGVFQPDFGFLMDTMEYPNGSDIPEWEIMNPNKDCWYELGEDMGTKVVNRLHIYSLINEMD